MDRDRARAVVTRWLEPNERLIWHDVPNPWRAARGLLFGLSFVTLWTAAFVASLIGNQEYSTRFSPGFAITLLFCLGGVLASCVTLKAFLDCWRTAYALTDRRIIIAIGDRAKVKSYGPEKLAPMKRSGSETRGSLHFDFRATNEGDAYFAALYGIENPARVETLIRETMGQLYDER